MTTKFFVKLPVIWTACTQSLKAIRFLVPENLTLTLDILSVTTMQGSSLKTTVFILQLTVIWTAYTPSFQNDPFLVPENLTLIPRYLKLYNLARKQYNAHK